MTPLADLVARPVAHRGLHDRVRGIVENSSSAALAAVDRGYGIECDVQLSSDGEAMVFHDVDLGRLTAETGDVGARTAAQLAAMTLNGSTDTILPLARFLDLVAGRVPVICEIKSAFDGDMRLAARVAEIASDVTSPLALKSFDPAVLIYLRAADVQAPVGLVAEASYDHGEWAQLDARTRRELTTLSHWPQSRPEFLSWCVDDLPHAAPSICRGAGMPVMTWTVRTKAQVEVARNFADQIVFEGLCP